MNVAEIVEGVRQNSSIHGEISHVVANKTPSSSSVVANTDIDCKNKIEEAVDCLSDGFGLSSTFAALESNTSGAAAVPTSLAEKTYLRPMVTKDSADEEIIGMMTKCWSEDPYDRPDFAALKVAIRKLNK